MQTILWNKHSQLSHFLILWTDVNILGPKELVIGP